MAESNPELQAQLQALDQELAEGDITQKGSVSVKAVEWNGRAR